MQTMRCVPLLLAALTLLPLAAGAKTSCAGLKRLQLPHVTITAAGEKRAGWKLPRQEGFLATAPDARVQAPFCRIEGYATPTADSRIGFEVWLPRARDWNGRFLAVGNPGFIGSIARGALAGNVVRGYATASTDTGHVDEGFEWAIGHPEKWVDWGHRAVHEMTVVAKRLIAEYYGEAARYSYWNSCHNGGNQGLNEAQRYPDDYDGIVAGDPAFHISRLQAGSLYLSWVSLRHGVDAPGYIPPAKYPVIHRAVLDACDARDGLVDGIIQNPPACRFDPAGIQCPGPDGPSCLTAAQVDTARRIYQGARFDDGTPIYSGLEPGSELGWGLLNAGPEPFWVNLAYFKGMVFEDPDWDFRRFDVDRDTRLAESRTGYAVDGANPDLGDFRDRGGKLILYQSWNETGVPPRRLTEYYGDIQRAMGGDSRTREFARLFVVPASGGCPGFRNNSDFDTLGAIRRWVEEGVAPDQIVFAQRHEGAVYRTRPVCPWPVVARYDGGGDPDAAANFTCVPGTNYSGGQADELLEHYQTQ